MSTSQWSRLGQFGVGLRDYWQIDPIVPTNLPIFYRIINQLKTLMPVYFNQNYGYSQDYGSIDVYDPDERYYPAIFFEFPDEETLEDDLGLVDRYCEETEVTFRVWSAAGADLDVTANRITADLGLFMENFKGTLRAHGLIAYDYLSSDFAYREVKNYPIEAIVKYVFRYRRVMDDIYKIDSTDTENSQTLSAWIDSTPIFNAIKNQIVTTIGTMTTGNGYSQTYGSIDRHNPDGRVYPAVFLEFPSEQGQDDEVIERYLTSSEITFRALSSENDIDLTSYRMRADFNKMFAANLTTFQGVGLHSFKYLRSKSEYTSVNAYPIIATYTYLLIYRRQKGNPYLT